ncbi:HD domain-containing protein [Paenibacillus sp. VCA1]|uniref:HD domain-containing protein n=1 Tax=Paenibacillus sp. VCA1 TaxID=3039148 RepID=UPI002870D151|nr:HD domain-containing protein [Paenibacillus sp. VCA1]MDR9855775.1 HD domain-containing protein [Paenibacillus sp. VCA1]
MNRIDCAIEFAAYAHRHQFRKGSQIPYISHPFGVAMILLEAKCKEEVVMAGLLHDTLEDTDTTDEDLRSRFGEEVLRLVQGASEPDKSLSWEERKEHTLEFLKSADLSTRQLSCADKLHNLRSVRRDFAVLGDEVWNKFKRGYDKQKWYYVNLVESLGYASRFPLLDTFQSEVESFFMGLEFSAEEKSCRRNPKFFDAMFECLFAAPERVAQIEDELGENGQLGCKRAVFDRIERCRQGDAECAEKKEEIYRYFTSRGIDFEIDSEGTDIIISACAAMQETFRLYPHEVYHHLRRSLKKGRL